MAGHKKSALNLWNNKASAWDSVARALVGVLEFNEDGMSSNSEADRITSGWKIPFVIRDAKSTWRGIFSSGAARF